MILKSLKKNGDKAKLIFDDGSELELSVEKNQSEPFSDERDKSELSESENAEFEKTMNSALRSLSRRPHSIKELYRKLLEKGFQQNRIDKVIQSLLEKNLLNDRKFAFDFYDVKIRLKKDGHNKIISKLKEKGIPKQIIQEIISEHRSDDEFIKNALILAENKIISLKKRGVDQIKIKNKIIYYLQNKGYGFEIIKQVINQKKL